MKTKTQPLGRQIVIELGADGLVTYRNKDAKVRPDHLDYAFPVFSVWTEAQAQALQVYFCKLSYTGGDYIFPGVQGRAEDLTRVEKAFTKHWDKTLSPKAGDRPEDGFEKEGRINNERRS